MLKSFPVCMAVAVFLLFAIGLPAQTNLLSDPDFENGGTAWPHAINVNRSIVNTGAESGTYCEQMVLASTGRERVTQDVTVTAGATYQVSGWLKTSGVQGGGTIAIFWFSSAVPPDNVIPTDYIRADTGTLDTGTMAWTRQTASYVAPAGAVTARFYLLGLQEPDGVGTVWFDNMSFTGPGTGVEGALFVAPRPEAVAQPDPFSVSVCFSAPQAVTEVSVYALSGARVAHVFSPAGRQVSWRPAAGIPGGVYFCRVKAGGAVRSLRVLFRR
jgi:hypothetical protein